MCLQNSSAFWLRVLEGTGTYVIYTLSRTSNHPQQCEPNIKAYLEKVII